MVRFSNGSQIVTVVLEADRHGVREEQRSDAQSAPVVHSSTFDSPIGALQAYDRVVKRLRDSGYRQVDSEPRDEAELTRFLAAGDAIDIEAALVYADFLSMTGDPRGEWMQIKHRLDSETSADEKKALARQEEIFKYRHRYELFGELGTHVVDEGRQRYAVDEVTVERWAAGFFESVQLRRDYYDHVFTSYVPTPVRALIRMLAESPVARFLRRLEIQPLLESDRNHLITALDEIELPKSLREIEVGRVIDVSGAGIVDVPTPFDGFDGFLKRHPSLRSLTLNGPVPGPSEGHSKLEHLSVRSDIGALHAVDRADWPALTSLSVVGRWDDSVNAERLAAGLAAVISRRTTPRLSALRLRDVPSVADMLPHILSLDFIDVAESFAINGSTLDGAAVDLLVAHASRLNRLSTFDLSSSEVSAEDRGRLRRHIPNAQLHRLDAASSGESATSD